MSTSSTTVGGRAIPVEAGAADSSFDDPIILGLLSYLAHWLNYALNPQLAVMTGVPDEAVPTGAIYPYEPGSTFVRNTFPGLYVFDGGGESVERWTVLQSKLSREIHAVYIFGERQVPLGLPPTHGVIPRVGATFAVAAQHDKHDSWTYGSTVPAGSSLSTVLGLESWEYLGGQSGMLWPVPSGQAPLRPNMSGRATDGTAKLGYPSFFGRFRVTELIGVRTLTEADLLQDVPVTIHHGPGEGTEVLDRTFGSRDGSEEL